MPATRLPSPPRPPPDLLTSPSGPQRSARRNIRHQLVCRSGVCVHPGAFAVYSETVSQALGLGAIASLDSTSLSAPAFVAAGALSA
ncbi:hypothetical protein BKA93DRAFT_770023 [Sparassis latifolia]